MEYWGNVEVNDKGHLMLGGCDAIDLADKYGTPLYVMEEDKIRAVCKGYTQAIRGYKGGGKALFASKAFMNTAMCKIVQSEGLGLDVVSGGEMYIAHHAGFDMKDVFFHGNNKTPDDLKMAVELGVGRVVIDSMNEIERLAKIASEAGKVQDVSLRIKPGIEAHTHEYIKTGQVDSKFGFGIDDGMGMKAVKSVLSFDSLRLVGIHCHIGSQIFQLKPFKKAVHVMIDYMLEIKNETGVMIEEINFGGGYGIHYMEEDDPLRPAEYVEAIINELEAQSEEKGIDPPRFVVEPGRSIVGEAGTTLYTVGDIKTIPDVRTYVSVDGGMSDNPRPALYQAEYTCALAARMGEHDEHVVSIAGRICESGDMLIWNAKLPEVHSGDVLAVFSTGAYNYSMASNYNKLPVPAVVLVKDGKAELMVRRQSYEDLISNDMMPSWL